MPAKLIINDRNERNEDITSDEGSTQGDVPAMAMYAIGTRPLVDRLSDTVNPELCKQVWYADDSGSAGKISEMRKWWDELYQEGPKYGYFPKPSKTVLIVKDPDQLQFAQDTFSGTGITISTEGERHLGAAIGNSAFKEQYVQRKVEKWVQDVEQLSIIANEEPQIALAAFTKALCMRWCFVQRTIPEISHLFEPLEESIRQKLIPAIIGRNVSDIERRFLALPVRLGGIGIQNPTETADHEFRTSVKITENLKRVIVNQERNLDNFDQTEVKVIINQAKQDKEKRLTQDFDNIKTQVSADTYRYLESAREKGAGAWLTVLPVQKLGYVMNKQEFRDSLCLRYGWNIPNTPMYCGCKQKNSIDHALICKTGGFVYMRHDRIRNLEASMLKDICYDIKIEPELLPIGNSSTDSSNKTDGARSDVSAVGIWSPMERTFLDVRIVHPNSPSYRGKTLEKIYEMHEREKKTAYNQRIIQVERATFTPLVFSTMGGMAKECTKYHKRVAELISNKTGEEYSKVMNFVRTRVRFTLLKSTLIAIRGERGKARKTKNISELSFNTIPDMPSYEI